MSYDLIGFMLCMAVAPNFDTEASFSSSFSCSQFLWVLRIVLDEINPPLFKRVIPVVFASRSAPSSPHLHTTR